jgi:hypothetical protein
MHSDFGSDGYSFEEGVRTPSAGERVRSLLSPIGKKLHFSSSPSSTLSATSPSSPTSPSRQAGHIIDDTLRPILEVKDKIVGSVRQFAEKRAQKKEEKRLTRAWEARETARIRAIIAMPCPIQEAKEAREYERLGRERREMVGKAKARAEKRDRKARKADEKMKRGLAKVTLDKTGDIPGPPPSIREFLEVNGYVLYPGEEISRVRLSQLY